MHFWQYQDVFSSELGNYLIVHIIKIIIDLTNKGVMIITPS